MNSSNVMTVLFTFLCVLAAFAGLSQALECAMGVGSDVSLLGTCKDDICTARRTLWQGDPITFYGCLNIGLNPQWQSVCNGAEDGEESVFQCCFEDGCNANLNPLLPSEKPTSEPTPEESVTPENFTSDESTTTEINTPEIPTLPEHFIECHLSFGNRALPTGHPGFCHGTVCYAEQFRDVDDSIHVRHGCQDETNEGFNVTAFCIKSPTELESRICCRTDYCNLLVEPTFPSQRATPPTTTEPDDNTTSTTTKSPPSVTTTGQGGSLPLPLYDMVAIIVGTVSFLILLVIGIVVAATAAVLCHKRRKQTKTAYSVPRRRELASTTSTESNISSELDSGAQLA